MMRSRTFDVTSRSRLEQLRADLEHERSEWLTEWQDLARFIDPQAAKFYRATNNGKRPERSRNAAIYNNTARLALRSAIAGIQGGMTSPARPWFRLDVTDLTLAERPAVKEWLETVTRLMREVFGRSNAYTEFAKLYRSQLVFGTGAMGVFEDDEKTVVFNAYPIGEWSIAQNSQGRVDVFVRHSTRTARQLEQEFGRTNLSDDARNALDGNGGTRVGKQGGTPEQEFQVVTVVAPNAAYRAYGLGAMSKAWVATTYELHSAGQTAPVDSTFRPLRVEGYDEFPIVAPRWDVTGENVYGFSPGMDALGDVRVLQRMESRGMNAVDKMVDPPLVASTGLRNQRVSLLPGDITYLDPQQAQHGLRPVMDTQLRLDYLDLRIQQHETRIRKAFYEDLFLLLASRQGDPQKTAREVAELSQEKLLQLGPVLERQNQDFLDPVVDRVFAIMERRGMIPDPPPELQGRPIKVEYVSILAAAQKLVDTASLERLVGFVGNASQVWPEALDKVDALEMVDEYARMISAPVRVVRSDEAVAQRLEDRAAAQQAAQQGESMAMAAKAAKDASGADLESDNALSRLLGASDA